jgi:hypothetical protein
LVVRSTTASTAPVHPLRAAFHVDTNISVKHADGSLLTSATLTTLTNVGVQHIGVQACKCAPDLLVERLEQLLQGSNALVTQRIGGHHLACGQKNTSVHKMGALFT